MSMCVITTNDNTKDYSGISMITDKVRFIIHLFLATYLY